MLLAACLAGCAQEPREETPSTDSAVTSGRDPGEATPSTENVVSCDQDWSEKLSPEEYRIARQAGTERAFSGKYWNTKTPGTYTCTCCGQPLFSSKTKFDSGSGWPSFYAPVDGKNVATRSDAGRGPVRTEVICSRCDAHLGHVFEDGPDPTGLRYCINSASLKLVEK